MKKDKYKRISPTFKEADEIRELPESLFPTEAGLQDLETLVNLFPGEFSQADTSDKSEFDKATKGTYEFGHESLRMYGVMFVHKSQSLKQLEKSWIGYLNREGSNPVKLSLIEYLIKRGFCQRMPQPSEL